MTSDVVNFSSGFQVVPRLVHMLVERVREELGDVLSPVVTCFLKGKLMSTHNKCNILEQM